MIDYLVNHFQEEINFQKDKFELDKENKERIRYMYFLTFIFINLLFLGYLDII